MTQEINIKVPTSWDDITLKTFSELEKYYSENENETPDVPHILHILLQKTKDEVLDLPMYITDKILDKMSFLQDEFPKYELSNKVEIDGKIYEVNVMEKMRTGEFIATDTILKDDRYNYAAILAILCRCEGEKYDSDFEANKLDDRIKMFENVPVTKVLPILGFFLQNLIRLQMPSRLSFQVREAINLTRKNIENLRKNGALSKLYMKYAMRKLKKLEKSINFI